MSRRKKWAAVRRNEDGTVDDVAITCDTFRLEAMSATAFWAAAYRGDERVSFWIEWDKKAKCLVATLTEDTIGCEDDS